MGARSKAFEEGFASMRYENPYRLSTQEYNDFERGWVQRIKQGYPVTDTWQGNNKNLEISNSNSTSERPSLSKRRTFKELLIDYNWSTNKKK